MIGIVVVSHSPALAEAAVALALEMVGGERPPIAIAAGAGEGVIGTDAARVAAAIDEVATPEGVLVLMDLGSAVLSAEMALEFTSTDAEVRLSDAPFVEGIVASVVLAAAGARLDEIERETRTAMDSKRGQLAPSTEPAAPASAVNTSLEIELINPAGLHSRPAATIVQTVAGFDAVVSIVNVTRGSGPATANSLMAIMALGADQGDTVRIEATGPQSADAVEALRALAAEGFGEV